MCPDETFFTGAQVNKFTAVQAEKDGANGRWIRDLSRGFFVCKELVSVDEQHHDLAAQGGGGAAGGRGGRREGGMEEDTRRKGCTGEQEWTVVEVGSGAGMKRGVH